MILINVKWHVKPEHADNWPQIVKEFTDGCRAEEGNLFFEWSRGADDPNTWYLVEGFRDAEAGAAHVQTQHFKDAIASFPPYVSRTPEIIYIDAEEATGWGPMAEVQPA
ncbi:putative quinol monooxygenase [Kineococcus gynurae]|uniref:Quinol monooxygenase n=1 Tax=Kineococcus gynurae TaxID=452979 RepID=A0ABV5LTN1_9ACTN